MISHLFLGFFVLVKPAIISFSSDRVNNNVSIGKNIVLTCKADGFPNPKYRIMFNGTDLCGVKDGSIKIQNVDFKDAGTYYCYANNSEGELSASLVVGVTAGTTVPTPIGKGNVHALHTFL